MLSASFVQTIENYELFKLVVSLFLVIGNFIQHNLTPKIP
jgi:hypothetical protein